ncbi:MULTISPECIES: DinB family protein [unclassified Ruegeria]|uniref:DinB family protein n=1 Tax=unclassified Ruegeria TaxID=2625375 RepID=UPI0014887217|nr:MULTISPECIES: DinB family protein [unclassified Ruegeria]
MISVHYCRLFARYNAWQNNSLITAADGLTDTERWADQGAFFKSISATLNHLYWADALQLARIRGEERPQGRITHSLSNPSQWTEFKRMRKQQDREIVKWATGLTREALNGSVSWLPLNGSDRVQMPKGLCIVQFFNHQTHHRGQVHAMLTALGVTPEPTDILAMPPEG